MSDNNCMSPICNNQAVSIGYCQECLNVFDDIPKPPTVTISREPMKEVPNYVALAETVKVPSKLKGRFESELFWTGVYAMRDALISDELTKALEVQGE